jgi:signal transduction histidine kinase
VIGPVARWLRRGPAGSLMRTVQLIIGVLLVLLVISTGMTIAVRLTVAAAQSQLDDRLLPAREAAGSLLTAYVDQETGQRGFLLSGEESALQPYVAGQQRAQQLTVQLSDLIADDPQSLALLRAVRDAAQRWQAEAAEPQIAARRQGPIAADQLPGMVLTGKSLFDALRDRLTALERRTVALTGAQLDRIARAQRLANGVALVTLVLALVVVIGALPLLRHLITIPLRRLIGQVQTVAGGAYDEPINVQEPQELATIAGSVDRMRSSVVSRTDRLVEAQRELVLREEHDRLATDLHDLTIQRIFALGLAMTSLARRNPELKDALAPLIEETDRIVREVRTVIFDLGRAEATESLRGHVLDLAEESTRALGFSPTVEFAGPVDTLVGEDLSSAVLAVLREALSNVARHASAGRADIRLGAEDGHLRLTVTDDGVGIGADAPAGYGLANMSARAARLGGTARVGPAPAGGTVVEWQVPLKP